MLGTQSLRARRPLVGAALALYVCFLAVSQFEHHDILCHLKTPQHCTSCTASTLGADPHPPVSAARVYLVDLGAPFVDNAVSAGELLPASSAGRSPPLAF
jgi:hypothetical protein